MSRKKGFTIIEMLVVIVIIGVILGIAIPSFNNRSAKYNTNYRNLIDELNVAKQKAITTGNPIGFNIITGGFVCDNDTFDFYEGISLTSTDVSASDTLFFLGNGMTNKSATIAISGLGYADTVLVTITGFVLAQE